MKVDVKLKATFDKVAPIVVFSTNLSKHTEKLELGEKTYSCDLDFSDKDEFKIEFLNKDDRDDNVVELTQLVIDHVDLEHYIYQGTFTPVYNEKWVESLENKPPSYYRPGTMMRHKGIWSIYVDNPVWKTMMLFLNPIQ